MSKVWARAALSHRAFCGVTDAHLQRLVEELEPRWCEVAEEKRRVRRGQERVRAAGAGRPEELELIDRLLITLVVLRLQLPHSCLAAMYGVDRSTISGTVRTVRSLLATRGFATPEGPRLHTLADVFAYAAAEGVELRIDGTEIQVRRPQPHRPGRRAFVSGKKKMNTHKSTLITSATGRTLWCGAFRPGRMHDQTAVKTEGIDCLYESFPQVKTHVDDGYRGLAKAYPAQVAAPPKKPKKNASQDEITAWQTAKTAQSSQRICVEHGIAEIKKWRTLQRFLGRRDDLPETIAAIVGLTSDRVTLIS